MSLQVVLTLVGEAEGDCTCRFHLLTSDPSSNVSFLNRQNWAHPLESSVLFLNATCIYTSACVPFFFE